MRTQGNRVLLASLVIALAAGTASAKEKGPKPTSPPESFRRLTECHVITDPAQRLACYDKEVEALTKAEKAGDIVIADRQEVTKARKGLFGFSLPQINLFKDRDGEDPIEQIETTVRSAQVINRSGQWQITLEDGAVWNQVDTEALVVAPKPGTKIVIKRAAMGSFKASIGKQPAIRVRRVQ